MNKEQFEKANEIQKQLAALEKRIVEIPNNSTIEGFVEINIKEKGSGQIFATIATSTL